MDVKLKTSKYLLYTQHYHTTFYLRGLTQNFPGARNCSRQLGPHSALDLPVIFPGDRTDIPFCDGITACFDFRQKQNLLLYIRGEVEQIHDLRDTGAVTWPSSANWAWSRTAPSAMRRSNLIASAISRDSGALGRQAYR